MVAACMVRCGKDRTDNKVYGFTLIELSIVLVIIGLITAGVLVGQTLIRQSQINSAMMDAQRYISAAGTFQQKYGSLPGDMANATNYWGSMTTAGLTCPPSYGSASAGGTLTCNGDGNGQIGGSSSLGPNEPLYFWQHLADAQLIQGIYSGIGGSGGASEHVIGTNTPAGRLSGLGFGVQYLGNISSGNYFNGSYGHAMFLGAFASSTLPFNAILTTAEAAGFDGKYDDGLPATGSVRTFKNGNGTYSSSCATTNVSSQIVYNTSSGGTNASGVQCSMIVITGF